MSKFDMWLIVVGAGWVIAIVGSLIGPRLYGERGWTIPIIGLALVVLGMVASCSEMGVRSIR